MMHQRLNGYKFLDDTKTRLAEVIQVGCLQLWHLIAPHPPPPPPPPAPGRPPRGGIAAGQLGDTVQ